LKSIGQEAELAEAEQPAEELAAADLKPIGQEAELAKAEQLEEVAKLQ
jgi:hypothetical protein